MAAVLFLFAHQDDEYFAAPWIRNEFALGHDVQCAYLTNGNSRCAPEVRNRETTRALDSLGVNREAIGFIGTDEDIPDGELVRNLERARDATAKWCELRGRTITRIYAPDFEGGHQDHDAAHAIAIAMAARWRIIGDAWSFTLYNAYNCPRPLFRTLTPLLRPGARCTSYAFADGLKYALLCLMYPSQARTWLGLFPESFVRRVFVRKEWVNRLDEQRLMQRPHDGQLLYEWMFNAQYTDFTEHVRKFLPL